MAIFGSLLALLFGLFSSLFLTSFDAASSKSSDTTVQFEINSIYQKLEEHYNEYGEYPTLKEVKEEFDEILPGIDKESLEDENGIFINEQGSNYKYMPLDCTALGCLTYTLEAKLADGTSYTKTSLN